MQCSVYDMNVFEPKRVLLFLWHVVETNICSHQSQIRVIFDIVTSLLLWPIIFTSLKYIQNIANSFYITRMAKTTLCFRREYYSQCIWSIHSFMPNIWKLFLCNLHAKVICYHAFSQKISGLVHRRRGLWFLHCLGNLV